MAGGATPRRETAASWVPWVIYELRRRLDGQTKAMLPEEIRRHVTPNRSGMEVLDLMRWAFAVRNVEPYPETRVFKATARELCRYSEDSSGMTLVIHEKPNWRTGRREVTRYTCADLGGSNGVIARARLS
jgi:hypothetical protein